MPDDVPIDRARQAEVEPASQATIDGRRARRDRNLELVLDATRRLFAEELLFPSVEAVARRSGLSVRSVYRYFADPESLISAAVQRSMVQGLASSRIPSFGRGPFEDRLERFVEVRVRLFEQQGAGFRATRHAAPNVPQLRDALDATRRFLRTQVEGQFAAELATLDRRERFLALEACDAISQFDTLEYLRRERRITAAECEKVLGRTITRALQPASPREVVRPGRGGQ